MLKNLPSGESAPSLKLGLKAGRALMTVACVVVVLAGLKAAAGFFVPCFVALFIAMLSYPLMNWMTRHRVPQWLALTLTVLTIFTVIATLAYGTGVLLSKFWKDIPEYARTAKASVDTFAHFLEDKGVANARATVEQFFDVQSIADFVTKQDMLNRLAPMVGATFGTVASMLAACIVVVLLTLFVLMEAPSASGRINAVRDYGGPNLNMLVEYSKDIQKFIGVKTLISLLTGVLISLWCYMFDLRYPLLWGILAFIFNFIPAVGSSAAGIPAIIEALVVRGVGAGVGVLLGYVLINFCLDNLVQPMLMGRRFGISGLVVVSSVVFWGWLWGPVGMFLAVPLTIMAKVILENTDEFAWVAKAMAKRPFVAGSITADSGDDGI